MRPPLQASLRALVALSSFAAACQSTVLDAPSGDAGGVPANAGAVPDDGMPDDDAPPRIAETGKPDASAAPDCRMRFGWDGPPASTCSAATAACVDGAASASAASACIAADSSCGGCFSDVVVGCLVGTSAKPGPCATKAGCADGCVAAACGEAATPACRQKALTTGACKTLSNELQACLQKADQTPCMERFRRECLPKPSCGNGIRERGEACDGDCPTSCPPSGNACTTTALRGSAATCSATCETQSVCPAGCPSNATAVTTVGTIAAGVALPNATRVDWPALAELQAAGCPSLLSARSTVIAWKAPAAGRYTFSATCNAIWEEYEIGSGRVRTRSLECVRRVAVAPGSQCAPGVAPTACSLDMDNTYKQSQMPDTAVLAPIALAAGDERLIAVDLGLPYIPPASGTFTYGGHIKSTSWSVSAATCTPQCSGKACGGDGCGGSCGTCAPGDTCTAGQCIAPCVPQCGGSACGGDGCGGSCGTCASGLTCSGGQCVAPCVPQCAGKTCGDNGCGGSCGTCTAAQTCSAASQCVLSGPCDPVANVGCSSPNQCITLSNQSNQCVLMGTGGQGASCADSTGCRGGHGCFAGTCRKICDRFTGRGCSGGDTCAAVAGWSKYGTCAAAP